MCHSVTVHTVEVREVQGCSRLKFNFSAHMNTMELIFLGGLREMCMFHEPKGFWPTIFLHIFLGAFKSHFPVSSRGLPGGTSSVKVNWSSFNFTSREHTLPENVYLEGL